MREPNAKKLKVLMLGWEFPPLLTGGLGPACYGLSKALSEFVELQLVLPHAAEKSPLTTANVVGVNQLDLQGLYQEKIVRIRQLEDKIAERTLELRKEEERKQQLHEKKLASISQALERLEKNLHHRKNAASFKKKQTLEAEQKALMETVPPQPTLQATVQQAIREVIEEQQQTYAYEAFSSVAYVNVQVNPYETVEVPTLTTRIERVTQPIPLQQKAEPADIATEDGKASPPPFHLPTKKERMKATLSSSEEETERFAQEFAKAKAALLAQFPEEEQPPTQDTVLQELKDALHEEMASQVAQEWSHHQALFYEKQVYGPRLMDKVAAYTEIVTQYGGQQKFDLIHAHDWLTFPAAAALKKATGKPLVLHVHSLETDRTANPNIRNEIFSIEQQALQFADSIVSVSKRTRRMLIDTYGIDPDKIHVVHNGIAPWKPPRLKQVRNTKNILFLGRVTAQKGVLQLIETASLLLQKVDDVRFCIAGIGDQLREAMLLAQQKGISDKIRFLGFLSQKEVQNVLQQTDVFFMPSVSDPFGLAALEAAQFGIPLVLSKQTGAAEVLPHSLRANYWETERFANYLFAALHYEGLQKELSAQTLHDVQHATWEKAAAAVWAHYQALTTVQPEEKNTTV